MTRKKIIHIHSNVYSENTPKAPAQGALEKGELAVNYNDTEPAIFIENNSGEIVKFNAIHRSEINQITSNTATLETNINNVNDKIGEGFTSGNTVADAVSELASADTQLEEAIASLRTDLSAETFVRSVVDEEQQRDINALASAQTSTEEGLQVLQSTVQDISSAQTIISEQIEEIVSDIETIDTTVSASLTDLDGRLTVAETNSTQAISGLASAQTDIQSIEEDVEVVKSNIQELSSAITEARAESLSADTQLAEDIADLRSDLSAETFLRGVADEELQRDITALSSAITTTQEDLEVVKTSVQEISSAQTNINETIEEIVSDIETIDTTVSNSLTDLDGRLTVAETDSSQAISGLASAQTKIESIEEDLEVVKTDVQEISSAQTEIVNSIESVSGRVDSLDEDSIVIAASLTDLDSRLNTVEDEISALTGITGSSEFMEALSAETYGRMFVDQEIEKDIEEVIESLSAETYGRMFVDQEIEKDIEELVESLSAETYGRIYQDELIRSQLNSVVSSMLSVTYDELLSLRNSSGLTPGMYYRMTDYDLIFDDNYYQSTQYISMNHHFDLILLAIAPDKLSELARATYSARDTEGYFSQSKPEGWQIWYDIDNEKTMGETTRSIYMWACDEGKGVIYRMIDEFGNDCPYDFKNVAFGYTASDLEKLDIWVPQGQSRAYLYTFTGGFNQDGTAIDASIYTPLGMFSGTSITNNKICSASFGQETGDIYVPRLPRNVFYSNGNPIRNNIIKGGSFNNLIASNYNYPIDNVEIDCECSENLIHGTSIKIGRYCIHNNFMVETDNVIIEDHVSYVTITGTTNGQNFTICTGCSNKTIDVSGLDNDIKRRLFCVDSDGNLRSGCLGDLFTGVVSGGNYTGQQ